MKKLFLSIFVFLCCLSTAFSNVTATLDKTELGLDDSLTLTITATHAISHDQPDLSEIEAVFSIIGSEHQINYSMINGESHATNQWRLTLLPKKTGVFHFPPIRLGKEQTTEGLKVEVTEGETLPTDQTLSDDHPPAELFIKTQTNPSQPFVHQQTILSVKVYNRRQLINVEYTPPQTDDALIIPLDQSKPYQTILDGEPYAVEELKYALFPHKSGKLKITPPKLSGMTYDMLPQPVHARGETITLNVQPAPIQQTPFLPANSIKLFEEFDANNTQLKQGETIIRTIKILIHGLPGSFLPIPELKGKRFSAYPNPPVIKNIPSNQGLQSQITLTITYLFNQPGTVSLPEVLIPWYDVTNKKIETSRLPPHTFTIQAAGTATIKPETPSHHTALSPKADTTSSSNQFYFILLGLILALLLLTIFAYWHLRKKALVQTRQPSSPSQRKARAILKSACLKNDPKATQTALIQWAKAFWPEASIMHLSQMTDLYPDDDLKAAILQLEKALYGATRSAWEGKELWLIINTITRSPKIVRSKRLPPLNY